MLLPDDPIIDKSGDKLGWDYIAAEYASQINGTSAVHGLVVGVIGPWGCGKSSMVNLVAYHLEGMQDVSVMRLNPWLISGTAELVSYFFGELSYHMMTSSKKFMQKAGAKIAEYGGYVTLLQIVPGLQSYGEGLKHALDDVIAIRRKNAENLYKTREAITDALRGRASRVVVIIDDLDRLDVEELREVFRLVRLTAAFPNLVYVIAFDRSRVEAALELDHFAGRRYIEKIVQLPLDVPTIPEQLLREFIADAIEQAVSESCDMSQFAAPRWYHIFNDLIVPLISNLRDVRRYALALHGAAKAIGREVNIVDLVALEAIRLFRPDWYRIVARSPESFLRGEPNFLEPDREDEYRFNVKAFMSAAGTDEKVAKKALEHLFPMAGRHVGESAWQNRRYKEWYTERRVAYELFLRHYLDRWESPDVRALRLAAQAIQLIQNGGDFRNLVDSLDENIKRPFINAMEFVEDQIPWQNASEVALVMLDIIPSMETDRAYPGYRSDEDTVLAMGVRLMGQIPEAEQLPTLQATLDALQDEAVRKKFAERIKWAKQDNGQPYIPGVDWDSEP